MITDADIAAATPGTLLSDGARLRLRVTAHGQGTWQLKLRIGGQDTTKTLGTYPHPLSIHKARAAAEDARAAAADTPRAAPIAPRAVPTFGRVGEQYVIDAPTPNGKPPSVATVIKRRWALNKLSRLHAKPITSITREELLPLLEQIQSEGKLSAAAYTARLASSIFDWAQRHGIDYNPAARRKHWLKPYRATHHAAVVDPEGFGRLAMFIDTWVTGRGPTVTNAARLLMRTVVRIGELRTAQWGEFHDLDNPLSARWEIPAERMKMKRAHVVPLAPGAVAVLEEQRCALLAAGQPVRPGAFVFPNFRVPGECMDKSAIGSLLASLGYDATQHKPHGFRSSFATLAREAGQEDGLIEMCLAHADPNAVRAAYNRADRLEARRGLMVWWDEYIETLKG